MAARKLRVAAIVLLALTLPCGSAFAAPPTDPPGKSGEAPGHQKEKDKGGADESTPPGQAKKADAEAAQDAPAADTVLPAELEKPKSEPPTESPRFTNANGKPKHNVPAAAEAAPETSVSEPGNSGRHKLTICHKGHAITVDVHAARAHVDGHGDTYAVAGAKGRAACPHSLGTTPTPHNETPSGPGVDRPEVPAAVAAAGRSTNDPAVATAVVSDPHATPTVGGREATFEQSAAGASGVAGVAGVSLPFTGARLELLLLFGLALVTGGALLRRLSLGWAPRRSSSR